MSNKELAVQLYCAIVQSSAIVASSPNYEGTVRIPTPDEAIDEIALLSKKLSYLQDN